MRAALALALLLGGTAPAHADALTELRAALTGLQDNSPIRARLEREVTEQLKDEEPKNGAAALVVAIGGDGLQVEFPDEQLRRAQDEQAQSDPDQPTPVMTGLRSIDPVQVRNLLGYSGRLLGDLAGATLVSDTPSTYEGAPARLIELTLPPKLDRSARKRVSRASSTMKLWCGADGLPLALEAQEEYHGRIFLIIGFEVHASRRLKFGRSGNRLVVLRHEYNAGGSGLGESTEQTLLTTLRLL